MPQFHPELNPRDVLPKVTFGVPGGSPNFSYDSRLSDRGVAWLTSVRSNVTYLRGSHSFKAGIYYEQSLNSEGKGGVGGGAWAGDYNFSVDSANTLDTNYGYANALLGNFSILHRNRRLRRREGQPAHGRVLRAGHVEGQPDADG